MQSKNTILEKTSPIRPMKSIPSSKTSTQNTSKTSSRKRIRKTQKTLRNAPSVVKSKRPIGPVVGSHGVGPPSSSSSSSSDSDQDTSLGKRSSVHNRTLRIGLFSGTSSSDSERPCVIELASDDESTISHLPLERQRPVARKKKRQRQYMGGYEQHDLSENDSDGNFIQPEDDGTDLPQDVVHEIGFRVKTTIDGLHIQLEDLRTTFTKNLTRFRTEFNELSTKSHQASTRHDEDDMRKHLLQVGKFFFFHSIFISLTLGAKIKSTTLSPPCS